jgi:geranyl-CoA carboxylase alpha subunit
MGSRHAGNRDEIMSRARKVTWGSRPIEYAASFRDGSVSLTRDGRRLDARYQREGATVTLTIDDAPHRAFVARDARGLWVSLRGRTWLLTPEGREGAARAGADATDEIRAPMTGRIVSVAARQGAPVREGDLLVILEAMKMEFKLTAPEDGTVLAVEGAEGDRVELGQLLVRLKPATLPETAP